MWLLAVLDEVVVVGVEGEEVAKWRHHQEGVCGWLMSWQALMMCLFAW
jgi:hypothetical protein